MEIIILDILIDTLWFQDDLLGPRKFTLDIQNKLNCTCMGRPPELR